MDDVDRKILTALQKDAQISMDMLSETVNLSRNACWRRVKVLEDSGVIRGRVALLDAQALGLGLSVFVMIRTKEHGQDWLTRFERAVKRLPEIVGAHRMSGDLDYVLRVRVADVQSYDAFYKRLISLVPISDISASFVMEDIIDSPALPIPV
jgi:Lrp/AsnC family transcriptional regulator